MPKNNNQKSESVFKDFTNLYELSKTLRFELKPVGKTEELLKESKVFEKDKLRDDNYHKIKYYFDRLHRKFIKETLEATVLDLDDYYKNFVAYQKNDKDSRKTLEASEKQLRQIIVEKFDTKADEWKEIKYKNIDLKKNGIEIFFEKDNLEILKYEFKEKPTKDAPDLEVKNCEGETENLFDSFKRFTTYFGNFNNSRRNFYSPDSKNTAAANRAIDENLRRFCQNKKNFDDHQKEYRNIGLTVEEKKIFDVNFYSKCLAQSGIDEYNTIIGRKVDKEEKGINQKINEFCQKNKIKLATFKKLDKQILSEKDKQSRIIEITNDDKVFEVLKDFIKLNNERIRAAQDLVTNFFVHSDKFNLDKIYIKGVALNTISNRWFSSWDTITHLFTENKKRNRTDENVKLPDFVSFEKLKEVLEQKNYIASKDIFKEDILKNVSAEKTHYETFINIWRNEFKKNLEKYQEAKITAENMISENNIYKRDDKQNEIIKACADLALAIYQMMKYFALEKGRKNFEPKDGSDANFYNTFNDIMGDWSVNTYYNEFRNYLTKKDFLGRLLFPALNGKREEKNPLSKRKIDGAEKIKISFECGYLSGGWSQTYETYGTLIFGKDKKYYLGVINGGGFNENERKGLYQNITDENKGARLIYNMQKLDFKNCPRWFINSKGDRKAPAVEKYNLPIETIWGDYQIYRKLNNEKKKEYLEKNPDFRHRLIDYFKYCLPFHESLKDFKDNFNWKKTNEYKKLDDFYTDAIDSCYKIEWENINFEALNRLSEQKRIYIFQIYNKDFGEIKNESQKNIHTFLFLNLLKPENAKILKLMGGGEIFLRPKTDKNKLGKKKDKNNKDVIDHKRYAEDKIFLHFPISIIGRKLKNSNEIKTKVNQALIENKEIKIVGIDRGENNLAYYSVINQKGKIIDSGSFNKIDVLDKEGKVIKQIDYLRLLENKAKDRDEARKNWQTIENIKELKKGYISQVVRKICDLILEHNAIVVFEDLSGGFKRSRMKIEKQIYQKLELALVKKLNYLVNKNAQEGEKGHYLSAYQLTSPVTTYGDVGKQTGIVFYTQAGYTSKTCPICGYRKNIGFALYFENEKKAKETISKFRKLNYNNTEGCFELGYNLSDFFTENNKNGKKSKNKENELYQNEKQKDEFVISSKNIIRHRWHNKQTERAKNSFGKIISSTDKGVVKEYNITECLINLFKKDSIDYKNDSLGDEIISDKLKAGFYKDLFYLFGLMLDTRDSISGGERDVIQCPKCGFDSDKIDQFKNEKYIGKNPEGFVYNGDANGAYNIARKGIMILEKIKQFAKNNNGDVGKIKYGDLAVNINEWDKFTQIVNKE